MVKNKKRAKNICECGKKLDREYYDDCPFCGGGEYYECNHCGKVYDSNGEEL